MGVGVGGGVGSGFRDGGRGRGRGRGEPLHKDRIVRLDASGRADSGFDVCAEECGCSQLTGCAQCYS